MFVVYLKVDAV